MSPRQPALEPTTGLKMTNQATHESRGADLRSGLARQLLADRLGVEAADAIYAALPTYTRGPKAGQPKGQLCWEHVTVGGWDQRFGVLRPGTSALRIAKTIYADHVRLQHIDRGDSNCLLAEEDRQDYLTDIVRRIPTVL